MPPKRPYSNRNWRPHQDAEWHTECTTLEELEAFAEYYKASPDEGEQAMYAKLTEVVVPKLRETAAARKRAADRQRAYEAAPKKRSGRIATLQVVREQEEAMRKQRAEEEQVRREQEAERRKQREAERKALQREIALQRAKEEEERLQREREEAREKRYQQRLLEQQKLALEQQKLAFERQKRLIKRKATDDDWDWEWWWDGIEDGSIFWRGKKRRSLRKKEGLQGGYVKVFRGGRSAKNGEPLRVRKPPTDEQIAKQVGKVVEKLLDKTEKLAARPAKRAKGTDPLSSSSDSRQEAAKGLVVVGQGGAREVEARPASRQASQASNQAAAGSTIPPGRTDRPAPRAAAPAAGVRASFAAWPLLLPQPELGAMGKVEGWLGGGGKKPRAAVQLPEDSAESSATRVDVDAGSGSEETAEHAAAAKIQDAWRRSPQRIRPEDSASNVGSALSQHTAKSGPGSAQGARLGFVLAAWGVAAAATAVKAAVSKARAAARPPKVRYQRHCFAPKFADRLNAPTVCVRVPEQIVIDLRADPKVMQVPTLEIQQPSPRPPKALAPSK